MTAAAYLYCESDCPGEDANRLPHVEVFKADNDDAAKTRARTMLEKSKCKKTSLYRYHAEKKPQEAIEFVAVVGE